MKTIHGADARRLMDTDDELTAIMTSTMKVAQEVDALHGSMVGMSVIRIAARSTPSRSTTKAGVPNGAPPFRLRP